MKDEGHVGEAELRGVRGEAEAVETWEDRRRVTGGLGKTISNGGPAVGRLACIVCWERASTGLSAGNLSR
jgi:hypothetical protein